jgi:GntR family transcriptional regulator/MocR family aminotransferase
MVWITVDRESRLTLARQIYQQVRQMILSGTLSAGYKLPSTRKLSSELSVSRNTVLEAYSQLTAEGYLKTYKGSGTVVAAGLCALGIQIPTNHNPVSRQDNTQYTKQIIDFRTGVPALEYFPRKEWGRLYREILDKIPPSAFGYCGASGIWELREEIASYLYRARGLSCNPDQIVITTGSTQGLSMASHLLKNKRKVVLVENPSHAGLRKVITSAGCCIEGVPVDDNGLCTEFLDTKKQVSFIVATPSHQYPMGSILSIQRRLELVRYAELNDCYIVEDDYDSEFRYEGQPVSSLYELSPERGIYLGSFSKILAPSLRLGFMIVPRKLLASCKKLKTYFDVHSDSINQFVLAQFIQNGGFERHIWKMKKHYGRNRSFILNELTSCFPNQFDILGHATGLHLVVLFHDYVFTKQTINAIVDCGARIYPVGSFYLKKEQIHDNKIILGYSHLSLDMIAKGVKIISDYIYQ